MTAKRIMIVAGEASGDMHGASLVAAIRRRDPDVLFSGVGGAALAEQGMEILFDAAKLGVIGLLEVFRHLPEIRQALRILEQRLRQEKPDLLILIDFPDFNLILAKKAKKLKIPVFYYITPQVWVWRSGRVRKIGRLADRIGVIFPFEKDFFQERGVAVDFVGHPLLDVVPPIPKDREFRQQHGIGEDASVICILPGSRKSEIEMVLPAFLDAARMILARRPNTVFLLPLASTLTETDLARQGLQVDDLPVQVIRENRYDAMAASDCAMAVSGTVTLELAIMGVPMVVAYRVSSLTHLLARLIIRLPYFSLVNLVAGEKVVPELSQQEVCPERVSEEIMLLLQDKSLRRATKEKCAKVRDRLGGPGAADRAAVIALEAAGQLTDFLRKAGS